MRLLDTKTGQFVEKDPETTKYAILSHTWDKVRGEQTYEQLRRIQRRYVSDGLRLEGEPLPTAPLSQLELSYHASSTTLSLALPGSFPGEVGLADTSSTDPPTLSPHTRWKTSSEPIWNDPELSPKIRDACAVALANGYLYIWIDSCCINKSSSSELSEAINSMYTWYASAAVCYAYLADVPAGGLQNHHSQDSSFRKSLWFRRGWTLQELIAPLRLEFLSRDWTTIGSKADLVNLVEDITGIDEKALLHVDQLDKFSVAQRLSWAAERTTTRVEDRAYSLLGIFSISMPTVYGEGEGAFRRLQEEIMRRVPDQSLFAWGAVCPNNFTNGERCVIYPYRYTLDPQPLLGVPSGYKPSRSVRAAPPDIIRDLQFRVSPRHEMEYRSSPYGIRTQFLMIPLSRCLPPALMRYGDREVARWYLAVLGCEHKDYPEHLLGRICYTLLSDSGVDFLYPGSIQLSTSADKGAKFDLIPLSPEAIMRCLRHIKSRTVHIPHPNRASTIDPAVTRDWEPYKTVKLVLLRETRDVLLAHGYAADLRGPDNDHPNIHLLTLTRGSENTNPVTVEFQHSLKGNGRSLAISARVGDSESWSRPFGADVASLRAARQTAPNTARWSHWLGDSVPWQPFPEEGNRLHIGDDQLAVDLALDFVGVGVYLVRANVSGGHLSAVHSDSSAKRLGNDGNGSRARRKRLAFWRSQR